MPVTGLTQEFDLETRNWRTKIDAELNLKVDGKELPNMGILGSIMEECIELFRKRVKESYEVVPVRDGATPIAAPYEDKSKAPPPTIVAEPLEPASQ